MAISLLSNRKKSPGTVVRRSIESTVELIVMPPGTTAVSNLAPMFTSPAANNFASIVVSAPELIAIFPAVAARDSPSKGSASDCGSTSVTYSVTSFS